MSSRVAVPLLVAAGVLLLAVAVLPSFFSKRAAVSKTAEEEPATWRSEGADTWSATAPDWGSPNASIASPDPVQHRTATAVAGDRAAPSFASSSPAVESAAARSSTTQIQASTLPEPANSTAGTLDPEISSWRDAGQWPYGNGVGEPQSPLPIPGEYPDTAAQASSYGLPPGVQGTPIPYAALQAGAEPPQAGMNRPMVLGGSGPGPAIVYPAQVGAAAATAVQDYSGAAAAYSADARSAAWAQPAVSYPGFPSTQAAGSYPPAAAAGPVLAGDRSQVMGPPIGTPIPAAAAAGQGVGGWTPPEPGVARLQGVIDNPSARTSYDYHRPSVY